MSLQIPPTLRKLQRALHAKAKGSPRFRFYSVYDKWYREDILAFAYRRCKANDGAAGIDRESFQDIEWCGRKEWLGGWKRKVPNEGPRATPMPICMKHSA